MRSAERGAWLFRGSAAAALLVHAAIALGPAGLRAGADLLPHLWLIQEMAQEPALRSVYAPAYHVLGASLAPVLGTEAYVRGFALSAAAALILGFRSFQRAAGLPDVASALFAWSPYAFALTWCVPKIEAAGYALAFFGLSRLLARQPLALALTLAATFTVHTAAALFLGLAGGVLALARRDRRALLALAAGAVLASPLFLDHVAAGCTIAQAFLFSGGDYLRAAGPARTLEHWRTVAILAGPIPVVAALAGAPLLWRRRRPLALLCLLVVVLWSNELWLAPFGVGTTLNLLRGLTLLAFGTAIASGIALAGRPRLEVPVLAASAAFAVAAANWVVPQSCFVSRVEVADASAIRVDRCTFRWRRSPEAGAPLAQPDAGAHRRGAASAGAPR